MTTSYATHNYYDELRCFPPDSIKTADIRIPFTRLKERLHSVWSYSCVKSPFPAL